MKIFNRHTVLYIGLLQVMLACDRPKPLDIHFRGYQFSFPVLKSNVHQLFGLDSFNVESAVQFAIKHDGVGCPLVKAVYQPSISYEYVYGINFYYALDEAANEKLKKEMESHWNSKFSYIPSYQGNSLGNAYLPYGGFFYMSIQDNVTILLYKAGSYNFLVKGTPQEDGYYSKSIYGPPEFFVVAFTYKVNPEKEWEVGQYAGNDGMISHD